ncbi:GBF's pro-rich region-interacting factor 1 [Perilla frutescens var. hirtella]|nr:GBF's pro-rich region-interacting factor 1 [Perilla frutescens var. hirtella]
MLLAVSPLRIDERESKMQGFSMEESEFVDGNMLDAIDFDDLFVGISDGESLPDLEMDHEILAQFSGSESETKMENEKHSELNTAADSVSDVVLESSGLIPGQEIACKTEEPESEPVVKNPDRSSSKKSSAHSKNPPPGKKKAKVDWTPELHRRFVQAVEQLGIDKAVPSRILEIMGTDCLTRHNIASHLQKYRSHRKHLLAREAEAASWSRRRQMYGTAAAQTEVNPWIAPTMGFPPVTPVPHHFRPLHVWGHPSVDQSLMYMWPKHVAPPHAWPPPPPPPPLADPPFWHPHHQYVPPPGTLFFPQQFPPTRFPPPAAAGLPAAQSVPHPPSDVHPSKESIDAAIGDVITKPWLPLPLGLKPPSIKGVIVELQRQGVSKIPPA